MPCPPLTAQDQPDRESERRLVRECSERNGSYEDPPLPEPCRVFLTLEQRFRLMHARFMRGLQVLHPLDSWATNEDRRGGQVLRNARNGSTYAAEVVNNG